MKKIILVFCFSICALAQSLPVPGGGRAVRAPSAAPADGQVPGWDAASLSMIWVSPSGSGSAPSGTVVNSGTPLTLAIPLYNGTTGTNVTPSKITVSGSTNLLAGTLTATGSVTAATAVIGGLNVATGTNATLVGNLSANGGAFTNSLSLNGTSVADAGIFSSGTVAKARGGFAADNSSGFSVSGTNGSLSGVFSAYSVIGTNDLITIASCPAGGVGSGSVVTTGTKGYWTISRNCTITRAVVLGDVSGSVVWDVWKAAGALPVNGDSITSSDKPTLSSATVSTDISLSWSSVTVSAGDIIGFEVESASTLNWSLCTLQGVLR